MHFNHFLNWLQWLPGQNMSVNPPSWESDSSKTLAGGSILYTKLKNPNICRDNISRLYVKVILETRVLKERIDIFSTHVQVQIQAAIHTCRVHHLARFYLPDF